MNSLERVASCVAQVEPRLKEMPRIGIVLGSGLGALAEALNDAVVIPYADIEGFPVSTAPGHVGRYLFGRLEDVPVVLMQGRVHLYEGVTVEEAVLPVRVMAALGVEAILLTNAAGAIADAIDVGHFCALKDHIAQFVPSPLIGANVDAWGPRFPDMSEVYDPALRAMLVEAGREAGCVMHEGVYIQFTGPAYETPAEIRMARTLGADVVGMSTVIEAVAARHMGVRLCGVSLATNKAAGLGGTLSEEEVIEEGQRAAQRFQTMVRGFLRSFHEVEGER
ncbi:MAG: purine-nucleoside phosphorylase [Peptoniphilaceae bacterium]|nr:purine-nucleoside phosphorylase [Peptoniphilaceae bacterium]